MPSAWKPAPGQETLIEMAAGGDEWFAGVVMEASGDPVVVDLGTGRRPGESNCEVVARFFASDALYRAKATLSSHDGLDAVIDLRIHEVERVQRRIAPRATLALPIRLSNFDDPGISDAGFASVLGDTIDIGEGGCRVLTARHFPSGCDPTVSLELPSGATVVALATVLEELAIGEARYEYRLVFTKIEELDRLRLTQLVAATTGP
jgi:hypothetical protein